MLLTAKNNKIKRNHVFVSITTGEILTISSSVSTFNFKVYSLAFSYVKTLYWCGELKSKRINEVKKIKI